MHQAQHDQSGQRVLLFDDRRLCNEVARTLATHEYVAFVSVCMEFDATSVCFGRVLVLIAEDNHVFRSLTTIANDAYHFDRIFGFVFGVESVQKPGFGFGIEPFQNLIDFFLNIGDSFLAFHSLS
jgi:hypothetical protein